MGRRIPKYRLELVREDSKIYNVGGFTTPSDIKKYVEEIFNLSNQAEEVLVLLVLDTKHRVIGAFEVSRGTINATVTHPREVFKRALLLNAAKIALAHNHPSGDVTPSKEDIQVTNRLVEAGDILGIPVIDHVIVGSNGYTSLVGR